MASCSNEYMRIVLRLTYHSILIAFVCCMSIDNAQADDSQEYLNELIQEARINNLHRDRAWQVFIHYKPIDAKSQKSPIDDPDFFLSADGKTNPWSELEATLTGLFRTDLVDDKAIPCRFPLRTEWLKDKLHIDEIRLPKSSCFILEKTLAAIAPQKTSLCYADAYINSAASMFGHTFLRIDADTENSLLGYALNYSAATNDKPSLAYAYKGVFGFYPGYFSISPYYAKIKEYGDIEQRDIWEYQLNLTEAETRNLVLHFWELHAKYSDYYFFDENCSYNILFLLEAARPSVSLTDHLPFWTIPGDTLRIVRDAGFVATVNYRPSLFTKLRNSFDKLAINEQESALELANGEIDIDTGVARIKTTQTHDGILEASSDLVQFRFLSKTIDLGTFNGRLDVIKNIRNSMEDKAGKPDPLPEPGRPDEGHGTSRVGISMGELQGSFFTELSGRIAYHELSDPDAGYFKGGQINVLDTSVRAFLDKGQLQLQHLYLFDIISLSPRTFISQPLSWKLNTGLDRELLRDGSEHLIYKLNVGLGLAYAPQAYGTWFIMPETDIIISDGLRDKIGVGFGGSTGFVDNLTANWRIKFNISGLYFPFFEQHSRLQAVLMHNFKINRNNSLVVTLSETEAFAHSRNELTFGWNYYF